MSRIADVLQKSREARIRRFPSAKGAEPDELSLRPLGEVGIPWQLDDEVVTDEEVAAYEAAPVAPAPPTAAAPAVAPLPPVAPVPLRERQVNFSPDDETVALARKLFLTVDVGPRHVLFGAVDPAGASATLALGLAVALAREASGSVCLVDVNLEGGTLHRSLRLLATPGLSDSIVNRVAVGECLQQVGSETTLSFVAVGSCPEKLRAALADRSTLSELHALLKPFDYVVAHAAPGATHDLAAMGDCFDGAVLILDAATTTGAATRAAAELLKDAGVPLIGTVLSRAAGARG